MPTIFWSFVHFIINKYIYIFLLKSYDVKKNKTLGSDDDGDEYRNEDHIKFRYIILDLGNRKPAF